MGASGGLLDQSQEPITQKDWVDAHVESLIKPLVIPADNTAVATPDPHLPALKAAFAKAYQKYIDDRKVVAFDYLGDNPSDTTRNIDNPGYMGWKGTPDPAAIHAHVLRQMRDAAAVRRIRPSLLNP